MRPSKSNTYQRFNRPVEKDGLARDDIVIAGLTRNPVVAWHWIPDRVRDDNFLARDDNFMTRDDNFLVRVTNAMAGIVSAMAELTATAATAASPPGC